MGKALIFDGITITNPIEQLTFNDGYNTAISQYFAKLTSSPTDIQKEALDDFYTVLVDNDLTDSLIYFYPMFGNVVDCAYGVVGDDLTIPTGAVYNDGLSLVNASGGIGVSGKGVLLYNTALSKDTIIACTSKASDSLLMLYNITGGGGNILSDDPGSIILETETQIRTYNDRWIVADSVFTNSFVIVLTMDVITLESSAFYNTYINGTLSDTFESTGGNSTVNMSGIGIECKKTVQTTSSTGTNFYMAFNKVLTVSEIEIVTDAIKTAQAILFT